jgi:acetylornithine deacetylase/succinyl-diaminopimelate desuccinylase-like protein
MTKKKSIMVNRLEKFSSDSKIAEKTIELLQLCIQTDTTNPPGTVDVLTEILKEKFDAIQIDFMTTKLIETGQGKVNLIVDIKGAEPESYPTWGFSAHLDVVPAEGEWQYPPFSGELVQMEHDRYIWGRGAMDMKQIVAANVMAVFTLLRENWRPKGDVKLIFEADEEVGGREGMKLLVENHFEDVKVDVCLTEGGGFQFPGTKSFLIARAEKGKCQTRIKVNGVSGHGSFPDPYEKFALYKLVTILEKIRKKKRKIYMDQVYLDTIQAIPLSGIIKFLLRRKSVVRPIVKFAAKLMKQDLVKMFLPLVTDTITPTIIRGGQKENVISPDAELTLDIRTLPGHDQELIYNSLRETIGDKLFNELELEPLHVMDGSISPINTPYYNAIEEVLQEMIPGAKLLPILATGATDNRYYRFKGIPGYGFSLLMKDEDLTYSELVSLAHAPDERISVRNLMLATEFVYRLMKRL